MCLGHTGEDKELKIKSRAGLSLNQVEMEAESVSYIIAKRFRFDEKSERYLSNYIDRFEEIIDWIYKVMMAASRVENALKCVLKSK